MANADLSIVSTKNQLNRFLVERNPPNNAIELDFPQRLSETTFRGIRAIVMGQPENASHDHSSNTYPASKSQFG